MAENRMYLGVGEESTRGNKEATTVGFIPLLSATAPVMEFNENRRTEWRGENPVKGDTTNIRMSQSWTGTLEFPMFTEAGTTAGMVGTVFKHFFGSSSSAQNASTGQYYHMMYPMVDPFATANLGTKGLTLNWNINEGDTMRNWPFVGGRVTGLTFEQEAGDHLKVTAEMVGQKRDTTTAELGSETFAAEPLRCDYNNVTLYTGTITRVGTGPNYTDITAGSGTAIKPDKVSVKIENGMEDMLRLAGVDYADKTRMGKYKVELEITIDWEDPASGFSSADDFNSWISSSSSTNFTLIWDTGTQAGSGDNHSLILDIPIALRMGGEPEYDLEKDPMVTLKYEGLYDPSTTKYSVGLMLKNTATAV